MHTPFFAHMQIISVIVLREQKEKQTPATNRADFYVTLMRQRDNCAMWNVVKLKKKKSRNYGIGKTISESRLEGKCIAMGIESITSAKCVECTTPYASQARSPTKRNDKLHFAEHGVQRWWRRFRNQAIGIEHRDCALKAEGNEFSRVFFSNPYSLSYSLSLSAPPPAWKIRNYVISSTE